MPWTGKSFKSKHNHSLTSGEAKKASAQANAILRSGAPEGVAIATANKHINRLRRKGAISERSRSKMSAGLDRDPDVDAATR